jgi:cation transport protein ChaC
MTDLAARLPAQHHPGALLAELRRRQGHHADLWVFAYASLIWRPEFHALEQRPALVHGWHRALRMRSRINRGTPERPGLVFALLPGGACRGEVYRLHAADAEAELQRLWQREMIIPVYTPRWLPCRTSKGEVLALAFTLSRRSDACTGRLPEAQMLEILRHARGRYGSTLEYLAQTAEALRARRIRDREIERLMALALRAGLLQAAPPARDAASPAAGTACASTPGSSTSMPRAG